MRASYSTHPNNKNSGVRLSTDRKNRPSQAMDASSFEEYNRQESEGMQDILSISNDLNAGHWS